MGRKFEVERVTLSIDIINNSIPPPHEQLLINALPRTWLKLKHRHHGSGANFFHCVLLILILILNKPTTHRVGVLGYLPSHGLLIKPTKCGDSSRRPRSPGWRWVFAPHGPPPPYKLKRLSHLCVCGHPKHLSQIPRFRSQTIRTVTCVGSNSQAIKQSPPFSPSPRVSFKDRSTVWGPYSIHFPSRSSLLYLLV